MKVKGLRPVRASCPRRRVTQLLMTVAQRFDDIMTGGQTSLLFFHLLTRVAKLLFKAQKRLIDEPREEAQKKRKVSEAEEEKDEQRFAFMILKAPFYTWDEGPSVHLDRNCPH